MFALTLCDIIAAGSIEVDVFGNIRYVALTLVHFIAISAELVSFSAALDFLDDALVCFDESISISPRDLGGFELSNGVFGQL